MDFETLWEMIESRQLVVFSEVYYRPAIIGITTDDRVVYSLEKMTDILAEHDKISREEAEEYIQYNTIRSLPYYQNAPVILYIELS